MVFIIFTKDGRIKNNLKYKTGKISLYNIHNYLRIIFY